MTPEQSKTIEKAIRDFHERVREVESHIDVLTEGLLKVSPDSDLLGSIWEVAEGYREALDAAYSIGGWLEWWWHECGLGENPMKAGLPGEDLRTVATIDDLVRLVLDDLGRADEK